MSRSEGEWHAHCLSDCMNRCPPLLALLASFLVDFSAYPARADVTEVDLALVLAVDISQSMDEEEQVLQREGFVEAFRSTIVHKAVADGTIGRISVSTWSGRARAIKGSLYPGPFWTGQIARKRSPTGSPKLPLHARLTPRLRAQLSLACGSSGKAMCIHSVR